MELMCCYVMSYAVLCKRSGRGWGKVMMGKMVTGEMDHHGHYSTSFIVKSFNSHYYPKTQPSPHQIVPCVIYSFITTCVYTVKIFFFFQSSPENSAKERIFQ